MFLSTVTTACASGTTAIGDAFRLIRNGGFDLAAGASEAPITPLVLATFSRREFYPRATRILHGVSNVQQGSKWSVLAEGSAILVLEELARAVKRGAKIYAEVLGCGATFDSYHAIHHSALGRYSAKAMSNAMAEAKVEPEDVDISTPTESSHFNDTAETSSDQNRIRRPRHVLP
jgi:3-oxoacyl-[acyl-carrier-protein] synthase II